jgi:hypothetical protein
MQAARNCLELVWLRPHLGRLGDGLSELAAQSTIFQVSVGGREFADKVAAARDADTAKEGGASTSGSLVPKGMGKVLHATPQHLLVLQRYLDRFLCCEVSCACAACV